MPTYEFKCEECGLKYSDLTRYDETGEYPDTFCPSCNSVKKTKLMSVPGAIMFTNPEGTDKMNNPEWAFGYKLEKAQADRRAAQAAQGDAGYNSIDDISGGEYFGEVE